MPGRSLDIHARYGIMAEINMVPLIDLALNLVVIFMIMSPFLLRSQLPMSIPDAETGAVAKDDPRALTVQVSLQGEAFIEGQPIPAAELEDEMLRRILAPNSWTVIVEADKQCPLEHVVKVMDTARKTGVSKLALSVSKPPAKKKRPRR
ncbi:MAG: biopolymer transporter ExbD [Verrucomicrobiota bacterium]|nr:biopolymer transporter ExbD [Verrucomicrobiota bacterium]